MKHVNRNTAPAAVENCEDFKGSNIFGEKTGGAFAVYSFGYHWPLYAKIEGKWYENGEDYGKVTTRTHRNLLRPRANTVTVSRADLQDLIRRAA